MPVIFIDAPPGLRTDAKRTMMENSTAAIDEAYHIRDTLVFLREHAMENVSILLFVATRASGSRVI